MNAEQTMQHRQSTSPLVFDIVALGGGMFGRGRTVADAKRSLKKAGWRAGTFQLWIVPADTDIGGLAGFAWPSNAAFAPTRID